MSMTISQGLRRVKKLKGDLALQLSRAGSSNTYKTGGDPAFRFSAMLELAVQTREELILLETRIARTNAVTTLSGGVTLTEATKRLRELKAEIAWLETLNCREHTETTSKEVDYEDERPGRHYVTTIWMCAMPVAKKAEAQAKLQTRFDELNDAVETANHRTELL